MEELTAAMASFVVEASKAGKGSWLGHLFEEQGSKIETDLKTSPRRHFF